MDEPVICAVARTPVGKFRGALSGYSAVELGVLAVNELLRRADIDPASGIIDEVLFGQVLQAGAGQAPARQVALGAGLPFSTPCTTINKVCGSSLKATMIAASAIRAGEHEVVIAGGMESMTNAPHIVIDPNRGEDVPYSDLISSMVHDGLWDAYNDEHMGCTGETVATEFGISRADSDAFAARSHRLANQAWEAGWIDWETFALPELARDEGIDAGVTEETLALLQPVFATDGQVTAGNASQLSDGGAAVLVASADAAERNGWPVLARIIDQNTDGVEPERVMAAPMPTVNEMLQRNGLSIDDIDIVEHNEAFASASCAVAHELGIPDEKFNPHGGAVAIGHPLGATGARVLMTLINALRRGGGRRGVVTICLGGGNAVAMLIECD